jgi:hypothetical protein
MFILTFIQMKMQFETPRVQFVQYLNDQMKLFFSFLGSYIILQVPLPSSHCRSSGYEL